MSTAVNNSKCMGCKKRMAKYDNHTLCRNCRSLEVGQLSCFSLKSDPCFTCSAWPEETWIKHDKAVRDASLKRAAREDSKGRVSLAGSGSSRKGRTSSSHEGRTRPDSVATGAETRFPSDRMSLREDTYDEHSINVRSPNSAGCQNADFSGLVPAILAGKTSF